MQLPAVRIAKERGWRVIVAALDVVEEVFALASAVEKVDLRDKDAVLVAAKTHAGDLDGVFTAGTDFSATVAWVAQHLGLPGISYETALNASDKGRMRTVFRKYGLPSPEFVTVDASASGLEAAEKLGFPLVVKPVDNMGARGVRSVQNTGELYDAVEQALTFSGSSQVIIEQFLEGPEFSLDAVVYRGQIQLCGIADRHICFSPYFVEMGHTMPTACAEPERGLIVKAFYSGIRALGIDQGAAKGDIKLTKNGPVIGEIAARLSGGYMSGWTYPYSSGISVTEAAMNIALGVAPGNLLPTSTLVSAERAFISIPGRVNQLEGLEKAKNLPGIRNVFVRVSPGLEVHFPTNNVQKCGNMISVAAERSQAVHHAEDACREVLIRLHPMELATRDFLFKGQDKWIPEAFVFSQRENLRALEAMPAFRIGEKAGSNDIGLIPLPAISRELSRDWHGQTLEAALSRIIDLGSVRLYAGDTPPKVLLGSLFWSALCRGGVQAGVWMVDSLHLCMGKSHNLEETLASWSE